MVNETRLKTVLGRRILAARQRGDDRRMRQLEAMLVMLIAGKSTAGMALIELQSYAKVIRNVEPIIRRGHGADSKSRTNWKSDKHRTRPESNKLRGGL
jgi:hypothetical protein